jgi:5-methylcytosine-specific restriction endonuclease McrA
MQFEHYSITKRKGKYRSNSNIKTLLERDGNICFICKKEFARRGDITVDHIIARSNGGTHDIWNLQLAHQKCNIEKSNYQTPENYIRIQKLKGINNDQTSSWQVIT